MTDEMERAEATARIHHRETGHRILWSQSPSWTCEGDRDNDCDASYPPRESGADR
jgi:hypothetical protein